MHLGNMLFENGRLACFLDFDSVQVNARIFDIAYFAQSMLFIADNYKSGEFVEKWRGFFSYFLQAYHAENKLSEHEIKVIHKLCAALQINFISFYLWQEEKRYLVANRADLLKWIYANEQIFTFSLN
jgi:Ser/Thr protein kinase RdoA (MazF antagonist)